MGDLYRQWTKVKFGGGSIGGLTETTIILGKGQKITELDYDNITINPLDFVYPLKKIKNTNENGLSSNYISIEEGYFITSNE